MRIWIVWMLLFSITLVPYSASAQEFPNMIATYLPWHVQEDKTLAVMIVCDESIDPKKINVVKNAIMSERTFSINDKKFYEGWQGVLDDASKQSQVVSMPRKILVSDSVEGDGDITIKLTNDQNLQGYSGLTKPVTVPGQILKSYITIYEVNHLSNAELSAIAKHEFGHAIGLVHATNPDDLMNSMIQTKTAYISSCDVEGIVSLYEGKKLSEVTCV